MAAVLFLLCWMSSSVSHRTWYDQSSVRIRKSQQLFVKVFLGWSFCQEAVDLPVSSSMGQADECSLESVRHSEVTVGCKLSLTPFSTAVDALCSLSPCLLTLPACLFPLSHLMRWRTREDSSVISPERFLFRQGRTSRSNRMMRTTAQTAIRA